MLESLDCDSFCLFDHFCTLFPDTTSRAFFGCGGIFFNVLYIALSSSSLSWICLGRSSWKGGREGNDRAGYILTFYSRLTTTFILR